MTNIYISHKKTLNVEYINQNEIENIIFDRYSSVNCLVIRYSTIDNFNFLSLFPNLTLLILNKSKINSFNCGGNKTVKVLKVIDSKILDLKGIESMSELMIARLSNVEILDLDSTKYLSQLKKLKSLKIDLKNIPVINNPKFNQYIQ